MEYIEHYLQGLLSLEELQESLWGLSESSLAEIGDDFLYYIQLTTQEELE